MAHESVIHRADAALALGLTFTIDQEVATDAVDEWMELGSLPQILEFQPEKRELLAPTAPSTSMPPTPHRTQQRSG